MRLIYRFVVTRLTVGIAALLLAMASQAIGMANPPSASAACLPCAAAAYGCIARFDACLKAIEVGGNVIRSCGRSPSGGMCASVPKNTVKVWDYITRPSNARPAPLPTPHRTYPLPGHRPRVASGSSTIRR